MPGEAFTVIPIEAPKPSAGAQVYINPDGFFAFYSLGTNGYDILTIPELTGEQAMYVLDDTLVNTYLMVSFFPEIAKNGMYVHDVHRKALKGMFDLETGQKVVTGLSTIIDKINSAYGAIEKQSLIMGQIQHPLTGT